MTLISLILLTSCSSMEQAEREKVRRKNVVGEPIYRSKKEQICPIAPLARAQRERYPWESESNLPKITKDFFRCKGSLLNPEYVALDDEKSPKPLFDCEGSSRHGFPIIHGKENVYPILVDLLNYVQTKTGKRVVITCGHRCPQHNSYSDPAEKNKVSKHQIGAEVDFYVQGMEERPQEIVGLIMQYYQERGEDAEFQRYTKSEDVAIDPWMNREIFIKLYQKGEGRDFDNRHPHPYICLQVRYDPKAKTRVLYSWKKAHQGYRRS